MVITWKQIKLGNKRHSSQLCNLLDNCMEIMRFHGHCVVAWSEAIYVVRFQESVKTREVGGLLKVTMLRSIGLKPCNDAVKKKCGCSSATQ